jgi:hypothetical protein
LWCQADDVTIFGVTLPWHEPDNPKLHGQPVMREPIITGRTVR